MKQNKVYPYGKKDGVVSIVGGSIIFATSSTSSTLISGSVPKTHPQAFLYNTNSSTSVASNGA